MSRAVILSGVRTPIGRKDGALSGVRPDDLAATVIAEAVAPRGCASEQIEDVYFGAANQAGEDNRNVARMAVLLAGLPESVAGITVNRLCASGLSAVVSACHAIAAGDGELFVAGGVESMSRAPLVTAKPEYGDGTTYDTQLGGGFRIRGSRRSFRSSRWARPARTSRSAGRSRGKNRTLSDCARSSVGRPPRRPVASTMSSSR